MRALFSIVIAMALAACDPVGPIPGGALAGETKTPPADWTDITADLETVQLETNPNDPYSVNIWVIGIDTRLYIAAGGGETRWSKHLMKNPDVRLRLGETIYELRAYSVDDRYEKEEVGQAYVSKYGMDPETPEFSASKIFRLDRHF